MAKLDLVDRFADVPLEVSAAIAARPLRVVRILRLRAGDVLATSVPSAAGVGLFAGGARIGIGECSATGQRVSLRLTEVGVGQ
jgi:flagellar motor switch/type III secretory pathway protein FliN